MRLVRLSMLCALTGVIAPLHTTTEAHAQAVWSGGGPVFQSDIEKRQQRLEAERAERRKSYGPVSYPKFMQGGEKPDIAPEKPPIAYLDGNEKPGTIIVDTGGRKLYYVLAGNKAYAYPISVGRDGFTWTGTQKISRIASWPSWTPPPRCASARRACPSRSPVG